MKHSFRTFIYVNHLYKTIPNSFDHSAFKTNFPAFSWSPPSCNMNKFKEKLTYSVPVLLAVLLEYKRFHSWKCQIKIYLMFMFTIYHLPFTSCFFRQCVFPVGLPSDSSPSECCLWTPKHTPSALYRDKL